MGIVPNWGQRESTCWTGGNREAQTTRTDSYMRVLFTTTSFSAPMFDRIGRNHIGISLCNMALPLPGSEDSGGVVHVDLLCDDVQAANREN